mgnify:CR=1 FL=1|jgi:hypothetical protein|tara:strand:- start:1009 stop:1203 length:195 start_codon:yes stop_codon:yes gene_type:complete
MKDTTKYKEVTGVAAPSRLDLGVVPKRSREILYGKVFGMGQETVQGKGKATQGTKYNKCVSGKR